MTERLLLDEHFSPVIARALTERGFDVRAVSGDSALMALADADLSFVAVTNDQRIVTENVKDFVPLAAAALAEGRPPVRLLLTSPRRFPRGKARLGLVITALDSWLRQSDHARRPDQDWLI